MTDKDNRWMHIWGAERRHGKSIPDSKTDVILQFMYLDDIIKEEPYTCLNDSYVPKTIRIASNPTASRDTSITVVIMGFVEDPHKTRNLHIFRDIYIRLESKEKENVEEWQFCIASLFSFLFSCRVFSGMRFNMDEDPNCITRTYPPYGRRGTPEEIKRASSDYPHRYKTVTPIISDVIQSWAKYYFSHGAISLGIHKYLQTVNHENKMSADLTIATICEAFQQCSISGENPNKAMKEWSSQLTGAVPTIDESYLSKIRDDAHQYYQNFKHFHVGRKWDRDSIGDGKVVAQSYFVQRFFQLRILHIILKDNLEVFNHLYSHLVEDANNVVERAYGSKVFN